MELVRHKLDHSRSPLAKAAGVACTLVVTDPDTRYTLRLDITYEELEQVADPEEVFEIYYEHMEEKFRRGHDTG